jgi:hypothetical protein
MDLNEEKGVISTPLPNAQAEVFWLAFQALPADAQQIVRERLLRAEEMPPDLAVGLESWQAASSEALMNFEGMVRETE